MGIARDKVLDHLPKIQRKTSNNVEFDTTKIDAAYTIGKILLRHFKRNGWET